MYKSSYKNMLNVLLVDVIFFLVIHNIFTGYENIYWKHSAKKYMMWEKTETQKDNLTCLGLSCYALYIVLGMISPDISAFSITLYCS